MSGVVQWFVGRVRCSRWRFRKVWMQRPEQRRTDESGNLPARQVRLDKSTSTHANANAGMFVCYLGDIAYLVNDI